MSEGRGIPFTGIDQRMLASRRLDRSTQCAVGAEAAT